MEDKIEVNEYVRTRAGHIYKITNIDENGLIYWNKIQCGWSEQQLEDIIAKHSKQLIELIEVGDIVEIQDLSQRTVEYEVYDLHTVSPNDRSDTTQYTNGKREVTLITCTDDAKQRVIVKCTEKK